MEIIPDEIYVNIQLKEYQKRGEDKKDIEAIKTQFLEAVKLSVFLIQLLALSPLQG